MLLMRNLFKKLPTAPLAMFAVLMALLPFVPEPHLWQKLKMLSDGSLSKPIDIFDLFWHGTLLIVLILKLFFVSTDKSADK